MKHGLFLALALFLVAACDKTPATTDSTSATGENPAATQQEALAKQKLTIEQAAEEATKLIEADAKGEIDAAMPVAAEPTQ